MNFFVVGLPRSRTAWLANFLTYEHHCYHEGMNGCQSIADYRNKLGNDKGDASTALMLIDLNAMFPKAPVVIIDSDIKRSIQYAYDTFHYYNPAYFRYLKDRLKKIKGLHIAFEEIDDCLEIIWKTLMNTPFNNERAELLKQMKIEVKNPWIYDTQIANELLPKETAWPLQSH